MYHFYIKAEVFNPNKTRLKNITPVEQQQEISELLERQVKRPTTPPAAEPPVTPNYKTIPLTDPLAMPPNFTPRQPVGGPNPAPGAKPSGLPFPVGKFAVPVAGAASDFAFRVVIQRRNLNQQFLSRTDPANIF
ncbi:hypothetical protein [Nostoc sp.]|uniref:hypothetical protein n=1 Tax=Nostoc sp. TaxID=1180 RepID=UPI002FFBAD64